MLATQAAGSPIAPVPWGERNEQFKEQYLEMINRQCGELRSRPPEKLHGGRMQSYICDKDDVFITLCEVARQLIYERGE